MRNISSALSQCFFIQSVLIPFQSNETERAGQELGWLWWCISKPSAFTKFETSTALAISAPCWLGDSPLSAPKVLSYTFKCIKKEIGMNLWTNNRPLEKQLSGFITDCHKSKWSAFLRKDSFLLWYVMKLPKQHRDTTEDSHCESDRWHQLDSQNQIHLGWKGPVWTWA